MFFFDALLNIKMEIKLKNYHYYFGLLLLLPLSGCISDQQQTALDQQKCSSFGYTDNNKLADCIKDLQIQRDKEDNANERADNYFINNQSPKKPNF